ERLARADAAGAAVALRLVPLGEAHEQAARHQHAAEAGWIEAFDRTWEEVIGLDAASAVNLTAAVGVLEVGRVVLERGLLLPQRVREVLIEAAIPWTLNEPPARRVVAAGRQRKARLIVDAIDRLDQR